MHLPFKVNHHRCTPGRRPGESYASAASLVANGHHIAVNNHRHLAGALGIAQHTLHGFAVVQNILIVHIPAAAGQSLTGRTGIRSGVLAEN